MFIKSLSLQNFRNFENINIKLNDGINILYGDNAQGKTNIIESLYICATGRSHRTKYEKELIKFNKNEAHIQIYASDNDICERIDIHLKKDNKKGIAINNVPIKKIGELFGLVNVIIFSPEDLQLIKSGPSERRRFMDIELCQINSIYYYDLQQYYKILKQRNNLLKSIQRNTKLKDTIFIWNEQLISYGIKIMNIRNKFIIDIGKIANKIHSNITGGKENLNIIYKPSININNFKEKLEKNINKDIFYGNTSYGPHKDDIIFNINDIDIRSFGSQGQQKSAALSSKLAEIEIIQQEKNKKPILLLDDVMSELDKTRQDFLINSIKNIQSIITCTGIEDIINKLNDKLNIYKVKNGIITIENLKYMI